jgi:hypothetical protein
VGCSEVCFTMWPTASVTAAWNITPSACRPARFTRSSLAWLEHDSCAKILQLRDVKCKPLPMGSCFAGAHGEIRTCIPICAKSTRESWI